MPTAEPAVFRPVPRGQLLVLLAGAAGGGVLGYLAEIPELVGALLGGTAAAIAAGVQQVTGLRVVASEEGLEVRGGEDHLRAGWSELRLGFGRAIRADGELQRYAIVADPAGNSFAFADLSGRRGWDPVVGARGQPVELVDLAGAPFLLGLLVQRMPAWQVLPSWLADAPRPPPLDPVVPAPVPAAASAPGQPAAAPEELPAPAPPPAARQERSARVGLLALAAKLGGKLLGAAAKVGAGAFKAVSGAQVGLAAASAAAYGILFSWPFAIALLAQLFVHEYGHVHAMRRTGMKVRGMYFIPFMGALAVTEDAFTSRRQQAYVALNGPLWGTLFTLLPLGAWLWTDAPFWAAVASWWALINLFNLLPISPLDGGRAMQAFAFSFHSSLGVAVAVAGLAGAVALGTAAGFGLIWLIAGLGAMELVAESRARGGGRALRLLPEPARFGPAHYQWLRAIIGPPASPQRELLLVRELARMDQAARVEPMTSRQLLGWGLLYAALAAGLLALVWFTAHVPGAREAAAALT